MAEQPKRPGFQPRLVDDTFTLREGDTNPEAVKKAGQAALVREGMRRQREKDGKLAEALAGAVASVRDYQAELQRQGSRPTRDQMREHGRHRFHQGIGAGIIAGAALTVAIGGGLIMLGTEATVSGVAVGHQIGQQEQVNRARDALDRAQ